jgi:hypothetical protein
MRESLAVVQDGAASDFAPSTPLVAAVNAMSVFSSPKHGETKQINRSEERRIFFIVTP